MSPQLPTQSPAERRKQERLRRQQEKRYRRMRGRLEEELVLTIDHVDDVSRFIEPTEFDLLGLLDRLELALAELREAIEQLNNPEHHIRELRKIRKLFPRPVHHDSGDPAPEDPFSPGASDEDCDLLGAQTALQRTLDEPGELCAASLQGDEAALDDVGSSGKLVELDRYRHQAANRALEASGAVGEEGSHEDSEMVSSPYTHQTGNTKLVCGKNLKTDPPAQLEGGATAFLPHPQYRDIPEGERLNAMVDDLMSAIGKSRTRLTGKQRRAINEMSYTIAGVTEAFSEDCST